MRCQRACCNALSFFARQLDRLFHEWGLHEHIRCRTRTISIDELRRRLKGNGLIAENEGVFHADHILIKAGDNGSLTVCAVAHQESDGHRTVARLRSVLAGVGNARVHAIPNALRAG